jgi:CRP-like cAMP-binding protein
MTEANNSLVQSLSKIPLLFGLEPNELKIVLALCKSESYSAGETIFQEGTPSHSMYILLSGSVDIKTEKSGLVITLGGCDIFGEIGLITQRHRSASAVANLDCNLLRIDHIEFNLLAGKKPRISSILMRNISTNLANHVVRMNEGNTSLEHIPQEKNKDHNNTQVFSNTPA